MKTITYWIYAIAWKIVRVLPEKWAYGSARFAADVITKRNGTSIKRLRTNYMRVRPDISATDLEILVANGMRSYLRYWCDTFRFPGWSRERILSTVTVENEEFLRNPIAQGRGCIVALPHAGNWDHAGAYFCATEIPVVTVAEHLEPEKLFLKFLEFRSAIGMEVLDASARSLGTLARRLRAGGLVALVADRDLSKSGVTVNFFGFPARMPAGPALLSIQTGSALITAFVRYEGAGIRIIFEEEIVIPPFGTQSEKVAAMIQITASRFERQILQSPADWHMLQRIWIDGDFIDRADEANSAK